MAETVQSTPRNESFWLRIIFIVSALVCAAVAFLFFGPRPSSGRGLDVSALPTVNASLNALTALLLGGGWLIVRSARKLRGSARLGRLRLHRRVMLTAFGSSSAFLVSYVIYHWFSAGPKHYVGAHRAIYLPILVSHIILAAVILPMALLTLYRGFRAHPSRHRRLARITLPLWLYVSVTGVIVYAMLYL